MTPILSIIAIIIYYKWGTTLLGFDFGSMSEGWAAIVFVFVPLIGIPMLIGGIVHNTREQKRIAIMTPDEKQKYHSELIQKNQEIQYGTINAAMMCPHCQTNGKIRTKHVEQKKGISGGKAVAIVLTGGLSLLAVGLSRKEGATQAHCENCNNTWFF